VHTSIVSALSKLSSPIAPSTSSNNQEEEGDHERHTAQESQQDQQEQIEIDRVFLIGGSQLYNQSLQSTAATTCSKEQPLVTRILLTRITHPLFPECDVHFPAPPHFTSSSPNVGATPEPAWRLASNEEMDEWVGWEVPRGEVEEKGVRYRFEMWVRR
jgi:dihydrofolate reductase